MAMSSCYAPVLTMLETLCHALPIHIQHLSNFLHQRHKHACQQMHHTPHHSLGPLTVDSLEIMFTILLPICKQEGISQRSASRMLRHPV